MNNSDISSILNYQDKLQKFCKWGLLADSQKIYEMRPDVNISADDECAFRWACLKGHLEVAQWLISVKPDIVISSHISSHDERVFRMSCHNGHLELAQWLLSVKPDINISANNEYAFCRACYNGHLKVAQWLLSVKPDIDLSADNEYAFRWACIWGYLELAQWLQSLQPNRYHLTVENGKITNWEVRVSLPIHSVKSLSLQEIPEEDRICLICQESLVELQTNCSHRFCKACIGKWYNAVRTDCPYCRQNIIECVLMN